MQRTAGVGICRIVVADSTRIHTQLLADAMNKDHGLQVVATASNSGRYLAAVLHVQSTSSSSATISTIGPAMEPRSCVKCARCGLKSRASCCSIRPSPKSSSIVSVPERVEFSSTGNASKLSAGASAPPQANLGAQHRTLSPLEALARSTSHFAADNQGVKLLSARADPR